MVVRGASVRHGRHTGRQARILRSTLLWTLNALFLTFFLFPFYWQTITALKSPVEVDALPVRWLPSHLYWGNVRGKRAEALGCRTRGLNRPLTTRYLGGRKPFCTIKEMLHEPRAPFDLPR